MVKGLTRQRDEIDEMQCDFTSGRGTYNIVILRWPVGSRMLHQNTTVIRRVTTVRTERGVRLTVCQGDVS